MNKKLKSIVIKVPNKSNLKLDDNDDSDAEVRYGIDNVSPSPLSIEDLSDDEIELNCNLNDLNTIDTPMKDNKNEKFYVSQSYHSTATKKSHRWIVDSGASTHMCHDISKFQQFISAHLGMIRIADGSNIPIQGKGTVILQVQNGEALYTVTLENVAFVPELDTNLISVKKLVKAGNTVSFEGQSCYLNSFDCRIHLATCVFHALRANLQLSLSQNIQKSLKNVWT